jgi:hypothetical protein
MVVSLSQHTSNCPPAALVERLIRIDPQAILALVPTSPLEVAASSGFVVPQVAGYRIGQRAEGLPDHNWSEPFSLVGVAGVAVAR